MDLGTLADPDAGGRSRIRGRRPAPCRRGCPCGRPRRPRACRRPPSSPRRPRRRGAGSSSSSFGKTSLEKSTDRSGDVVEDLGLEHEDAGVDGVAEHLAPRRLLEEALDRAVLVGDDDAELERVLDVHEADGGQRLVLVVEVDDATEVDVGEHVARDHEEPLVEVLHGIAHRPGGAERRLLGRVDDADAELAAVAEVGADARWRGTPPSPRSRRCRAASSRPMMCSIIGRLTSGSIGLGAFEVSGPQPGALASGHDHCLHGGPRTCRRTLHRWLDGPHAVAAWPRARVLARAPGTIGT